MTAQHAKERKIMNRWAEASLLDVRLEEKFNRDRIMMDRKDTMESFRMLLLALAPVESRIRGAGSRKALQQQQQTLAVTNGRHQQSPQQSPSRQPASIVGNLSVGSEADLGATLQPTLSEGVLPVGATSSSPTTDRLQQRIIQLERQLAMKMKLDWLVPPEAPKGVSIFNADDDTSGLVQAAEELEGVERAELLNSEEVQFESLSLRWRMILVDHHSVQNRRQLIVTPYNAYRPQIPIQNSLQGEEFLRRWLLAETFKHYEDVCTQCQRWENDVRCEIEDAAFAGAQHLREAVFFPLYQRRCAELEVEMVALHKHKVRHERDAATLALQSNMDLVYDEEIYARDQVIAHEKDAWERIGAVSSMLGVLKDAERRATTLKRELARQGQRYQEEIAGLTTTLAEQLDSRPKGVARVEDYKQGALVPKGDGGGSISSRKPIHGPRPPPSSAPKPSGSSYVEQVYGKRRAPRQLAALPQGSSSARSGSTDAKKSAKRPPNDYWAGF